MIGRILAVFEDLPRNESMVVCLAVLLTVAGGAVWRGVRGAGPTEMTAWKVGGDFAEFYVAGRILNEYGGGRLYDMGLQQQLYMELEPGMDYLGLPYLYPPFIAAPFRLLAAFPRDQALVLFMILTPCVFGAGVARLVSHFGPAGSVDRRLAYCAAFSFAPFLTYTWLGAQISVVALLAVAFFLVEEDRGRFFRCGMWLALCVYKPSLLIVLLPVIAAGRNLRTLAGFACGTAGLGVLSIMAAGVDGLRGFLEKMFWMSRLSTINSGEFKENWYVDLNAFVRGLPFGRSEAGAVAAGLASAAIGLALIIAAWRGRNGGRRLRLLLRGAALALGLAANIYSPFYDCVLLLAAAAAGYAGLREAGGARAQGGFNLALAALWTLPWAADFILKRTGIQVYTLAILAFGFLLWVEMNREGGDGAQGRRGEEAATAAPI